MACQHVYAIRIVCTEEDEPLGINIMVEPPENPSEVALLCRFCPVCGMELNSVRSVEQQINAKVKELEQLNRDGIRIRAALDALYRLRGSM